MITEAEELTINLWFPIHSVLKPPNTFESRESNQSDFWPLKRERVTLFIYFSGFFDYLQNVALIPILTSVKIFVLQAVTKKSSSI
jgi:hypothetical protein